MPSGGKLMSRRAWWIVVVAAVVVAGAVPVVINASNGSGSAHPRERAAEKADGDRADPDAHGDPDDPDGGSGSESESINGALEWYYGQRTVPGRTVPAGAL